MTQIDLYGVSSGRSIADAIDDDDERLRQRRLSNEQKVKQDQRNFALRNRLTQFEISPDLPTQQLIMHEPPAGSQRPPRSGDGRSSQSPLKRSVETVKSNPPDLHPDIEYDFDFNSLIPEAQQQRRAGQSAERSRRALATPKATEQISVRNQSSLIQSPRSPEPEYSAKDELSPKASLPEKPAVSDAGIEYLPTHAPDISSIVDSLNDLRGSQFAELLSSKLSELLTHLHAHPESSCNLNERDELQASLEFLEGYIEASEFEWGARQQLKELTSQVRLQLLSESQNSSLSQPLILASAAVAQGGERIQLGAAAVPDRRNSVRDRVTNSKRNLGVTPDVEQETLESTMSTSGSEFQAVQRPSKSSLSKDQEKRREETLVSVTVRAV